ncbi:MAG TPA: right-handed parallel beta-helix repeat-containing protein [Steroidobacteraceae bacterium]|nr:right-handed parallel beta-helix repeat-containing protein [Steroidobacteraceae bacterium]
MAQSAGLVGRAAMYAICSLWLVLGLDGCGKPAVKPTGTVLVSMADNSYSPAIVRVPVGGSIVFINAGRNDHNAIAVDKSWSSERTFGNIKMRPGDMSEIVFSKEGVYPFYCSFHATPDGKVGMVGVVVVGNVDYTPPGTRGVLAAVESATGVTRRVPQDYPTIQNGVDAANPGDLVLIDKGEYTEAVFVTTPSITLRGVDRNAVILDGKFELGTGIMVGANGVAIENMTARNYTLNGFYWTGVRGFRGSYLTAYNNGDYGIYAFGSTDGLFEHSYASGSPDSAFYVGQCAPCRVVLNDVVGEYSGLGYSGTNSSGSMYVINSRFSHNRSGISTTTFDIELTPPGRDTTIIGNVISDSGLDNEAAGFYATETLAGNGIALVGTHNNHVERNYVVRSRNNGIVVIPILDRHYWPSTGHVIRNNTVLDSGRADLAASGLGTIGNCFSGNVYRSSLPWGLQTLNGCRKFRIPVASDLSGDMTFFGSIAQIRAGRFTLNDYRTRPVPAAQAGIPEGADARVIPAVHPFADLQLNLDAIKTPTPQL